MIPLEKKIASNLQQLTKWGIKILERENYSSFDSIVLQQFESIQKVYSFTSKEILMMEDPVSFDYTFIL